MMSYQVKSFNIKSLTTKPANQPVLLFYAMFRYKKIGCYNYYLLKMAPVFPKARQSHYLLICNCLVILVFRKVNSHLSGVYLSLMYKIFILSFFLACYFPVMAQQSWQLSTEKDGMKIYTGTVSDSKFKAIKVECDYNATLSQLVSVLLDVKTCPEWVYNTKSCVLLKQISPSELYYYSEVSIPWPAQNRDFVAHLTVTQNPETKVVYMDGPAIPGMVPIKKGIVRIDHSTGKWAITPIAENRIHVVYTLQVDPGGAIPAWLVNMFAAEGPSQSFKKLRLQLQKPAYRNASLSFIKD